MLFFGFCMALVAMDDSTTTVTPHSVYKINLSGALVEQGNNDALESALAEFSNQKEETVGLNDLLQAIQAAKENADIEGIYLYGGSMSAGYASREALRRALEDFKQSGKFVVAYAQDYSQGNYYLASVADKIYLNAHGTIDWSGLYSSSVFYTRALDKLGVEMQVIKVGTFKSAVEPYMLTHMSEPNKEQMTVLLQDIWGVMRQEVAQGRQLSEAKVDAYAARNMSFEPVENYVACGLVDSLIYDQDMDAVLENYLGTEDYTVLTTADILALPDHSDYQKNKVAVLYAEGEITDDSGDGIVGKKMVKTINKLAKDSKVKAVVLRVNSPGGSADASEQIWHALQLLKNKKPLVVSMSDYAASGGYYISCGADTIFAEPNTLTGSIGIYGLVPNTKGLTDKLGIDFDGIGTHPRSGVSQTMVVKGMSNEERQLMQATINRGYELFVSRCAEGRKMSVPAIKNVAEGRVWSGQKALELGLVDKLGSMDEAVRCAAQMADVEHYEVVEYPKPKDSFDELLDALLGTSSDQEAALKNIKTMLQKPSIQARLPYDITIQ